MSFRPQYNETDPTMTDGQYTSGRVDTAGRLLVAISGATLGNTDDAAWDGVAADATVISLLKAIALNTGV